MRPSLERSAALAKVSAKLPVPVVQEERKVVVDEAKPSPPVPVVTPISPDEALRRREIADIMLSIQSASNDSIHSRIESLRAFLESKLGDSLLVEVYRAVDAIKESEASDSTVVTQLKDSMGSLWIYLPLVLQLINCEQAA